MPTDSAIEVVKIFEQLEGGWEFTRQLGMQGTMEGVARFQPKESGVLHYQEQGTITFANGKVCFAHRAYGYVYSQGAMAVHFWDPTRKQPGALLHQLQFCSTRAADQPLKATGIHHCARDVYEAHYWFMNAQQFQLTYQVQGPKKDYTIQTDFSRKAVELAIAH